MDETVEILLLDKCLDRLKDFQGSCCAATRGCSDENGGNRISRCSRKSNCACSLSRSKVEEVVDGSKALNVLPWLFFLLDLVREKDSIHSSGVGFCFYFVTDHGHGGHGTAADTSHRIEIEFSIGRRFSWPDV